MNLKLILSVILMIAGTLMAQNPASWEPANPFVGDSILISFDPAQSSAIPDGTTSLVLHWGVNETSAGAWNPPPADLWPAGTLLYSDNKAVESPMQKNGAVWEIKIPTDARIQTVHFVVNTGPTSNPLIWDNNNSKNWNITVTEQKLHVLFISPETENLFGDPERSPAFIPSGGTLEIKGIAAVNETELDSLKLFINQTLVAATVSDTLRYLFDSEGYDPGIQRFFLIASDTAGVSDTAFAVLMINPAVQDISLPEGVEEGINYQDDRSVILCLFAPYKEFIYVIGDVNDWRVSPSGFLNRYAPAPDSVWWWIEVDSLTSGQEYAFQYLVDGTLRIADPYTQKVLDPRHDDEIISKGLYPGLKVYPKGKTTEPVAVLQPGHTGYRFQNDSSYTRPPKEALVIYELLLRDFLAQHDYSTLTDTLAYFERLGINAIELMPVNEFEGNSSWGYNPSFYFAPDKYYGPADSLKKFVDECHKHGIAVILDMVLNHTYGQSPMVRLYFANGQVTAESPWYNIIAPHTDYSWGYDFNHERQATRRFVTRVNRYWIEEFGIDGYRFDFTRGFTNRNGTSGGYDASRISILERMADQIWSVDSSTYIILEHLIDSNDEMQELAHYRNGMMLWANTNYNYNEAAMGYNDSGKSDFSWGFYKTRGWTKPNLVTYMESHDEERLMFKNLQYGNSSGGYDIKQLETALNRMKLAGAFFFTWPGAKMIWQFGELGYDQSIENPCRLCEKAPVWSYYQNELRKKLYKTWAALIHLRETVPAFTSAGASVELSVNGAAKRIRISHSSMNVIIIGNFDVVPRGVAPNFYYAGTWYDYFSGETVNITDGSAAITLKPGEFHIYTSKKLPTPEDDILNSIKGSGEVLPREFRLEQNYPNPFNPETRVSFQITQDTKVDLVIFDILGRKVAQLLNGRLAPGRHTVVWNATDLAGRGVGSGVYICRLRAETDKGDVYQQQRKMVLLK